MIPLRDDNPRIMIPVANYLIIGVTFLVFLYGKTLSGSAVDSFYKTFGAVPAKIVAGHHIHGLVTSIFLHVESGWRYIFFNMLWLYIFGDNIEGVMGHLRYLAFYLVSGIIASTTHVFFFHDSTAALIGASGAVSGVVGAYFIKYPRAKISFFGPLIPLRAPAIIFLLLWLLLQTLGVIRSLSSEEAREVSYAAHVGGFIAGALLVNAFQSSYAASRQRRLLAQQEESGN